MADDNMFSPEYQPDPATQADAPVPDEPQLIEYQLEERVKEEVRIYGTGKPRYEFIRAVIIHD